MRLLIQNISHTQSAWYYNHTLYPVGESINDEVMTHGKWLSDHAKEFGFTVPELEWDDDGSENWRKAMKIAFEHGFIRIQKFNSITTISVYDFSKKYIDNVFALINDYPEYFSQDKNIEIMTLEYEQAMFDENFDYPEQGNYILADNVIDLMEKLG